MLIDGLTMLEGSSAQNLTVAKGTSFPSSPTEGELFYRTDGVNEGLYVYNGESWVQSGGNAFDPAGNQTITGTWSFSNAVTVGTPTAANHAVTKSYADSLASGVDPKDSVRAATTANITLSGTQTVDGVALAVGDRVLVKNQTLGTQNGLYTVAAGAWTRTSDFDGSPSTEVTSGAYVFVTGGSTNGQKGFILTTNDPITVGSTVLSWTQFSGSPTVVDLTGATGNLSVNNLNDGTNASATTFWRGDGIWSTAVTSIAVSGGSTGLTTSGGPITSSGTITLGGTLAIANGGTGQTSAANAINALVPSQSGNSGKFLTTNGSVVSWGDAAGSSTFLDGTGTPSPSISATGVYVGALSSVPTSLYVNAAASAGNKAWESRVDNSGRYQINLYNDSLSSNPTVVQITRSGQTATEFLVNATNIDFNGAVVGDSFSGVGTALTALNGSNITSGTVAPARLGSGTPTASNFLRGDGAWASPSLNSLFGSGSVAGYSATTSAVNAGSEGIFMVNGAASANNRVYSHTITSGGQYNLSLVSDGGTAAGVITINRSANTATSIVLTATAINLAVGTSGLQLNGSAGSSGQVLTSQGASAAPIWSSPALTSLNGTGSVTLDLANTATRAGTASSEPALTFTVSAAPANQKLSTIRFNSAGTLRWTFNTDANSETNWLTVTRSAATASLITFTGTGMNLALGASGLQLNGSAGTAGQMLMSNGAAAPTWSSTLTGSLVGSANQSVASGTTAVVAGVLSGGGASFNGRATLALTSSSASAGNRVWGRQVAGSGDLFEYLWDDTQANGVAWLQVARSANVATNITLTGTAVTVAARMDFSKSYTELNNTATATASTTIDCSLGNIFTVTMSASITTLAFSNIPTSGRAYNMTLILKQDATGGRSITWPAAVKFPSGTAPTLSGANKTDIVTLLTTDGGTIWYATVGGQNF